MSDQSRHERRVAELMQYGETRAAAEEIAAIELGELSGCIPDTPEIRRLRVRQGPSIIEQFGPKDAGNAKRLWQEAQGVSRALASAAPS